LPFYHLYELNHAALAPWRAVADATRLTFANPFNPLSETPLGRSVAAAAELFERTTRRYGKPEFDLAETTIGGRQVAVEERVVWQKPFCSLVHFHRDLPKSRPADPTLIVVAPMSGHYATLLRGTVGHPASRRPGRPYHGGVPAFGAGAGGNGADGRGRRPGHAGLNDADGRPDRHAHQSDRGQ
jgi:hypothetical protein